MPPPVYMTQHSLPRVWEHVSVSLREVRAELHAANDSLYGAAHERITYLSTVQHALSTVSSRRVTAVQSFSELRDLVDRVRADSCRHSRVQREAIAVLTEFHTRCKQVFHALQALKTTITEEILQYLHLFCSDYHKLGIADDAFYDSLQSRTEIMENYMERFQQLSAVCFIEPASPIPQELFGYSFFSQELAIELECDTFPVLRVIPDLIQKLEMSCDLAADWLRSDKVYVQEMQQEIENYQTRVHKLKAAIANKNKKYENLYTELKTLQSQQDQQEIMQRDLKKDIAKLRVQRAQVQCQVRTQKPRRNKLRKMHSFEEVDNFCGSDSEEENYTESTAQRKTSLISLPPINLSQNVQSDCDKSYKNESNNNKTCLQHVSLPAINQSENLLHSQQQQQHYTSDNDEETARMMLQQRINRDISQKQYILQTVEDMALKVQRLSSKLRAIGRKKLKLAEELQWRQGQLHRLSSLLQDKMSPESKLSNNAQMSPQSKRGSHGERRQITSNNTRNSRHRENELETAFHLVKKQIGLAWKDLMRALPYNPMRSPQEINVRIQEIEYEHRGHLKEQAYQALTQWQIHNGKKASVQTLEKTLRDVEQTYLADQLCDTFSLPYKSDTS